MKMILSGSLFVILAAFALDPVSARHRPSKTTETPGAWPELQSTPPEMAGEFLTRAEAARKIESGLKFQRGVIDIRNGLATITLSGAYRYLDSDDAEKVIVDLWGNPPREKSLGMIVPASFKALDQNSWGVIITYDEKGYVKDDEAAEINYDDLLKEMQEATRQESEKRARSGQGQVELVGWAQPPRYDYATHKLYWARELKFDGTDQNILNYDIRALGRRGVLSLNAVAAMGQLQHVEKNMQAVLGFVEFNEGQRYTDYHEGMDKLAEYGIAALIAGKVAAKVGLFKMLLGGLLAFKKFIVLAALAAVGFLRRWFGRKSDGGVETLSIAGAGSSSEVASTGAEDGSGGS